MSGLPDIGMLKPQVGYSRLAWARLEAWLRSGVAKLSSCGSLPTAMLRDGRFAASSA